MAVGEEDILPSSLGIPQEVMQARKLEEANAEQVGGGGQGDDKGGQEERESEQTASWLRRYRMYTHTHTHTHTHITCAATKQTAEPLDPHGDSPNKTYKGFHLSPPMEILPKKRINCTISPKIPHWHYEGPGDWHLLKGSSGFVWGAPLIDL